MLACYVLREGKNGLPRGRLLWRAKMKRLMQSLRNLFSGLLSPRQEQKPHVVLVAGGARSGKTNLVYRLATLDANWKDSADEYAGVIGYQIYEDQMVALDDLRVRRLKYRCDEPGAKVGLRPTIRSMTWGGKICCRGLKSQRWSGWWTARRSLGQPPPTCRASATLTGSWF